MRFKILEAVVFFKLAATETKKYNAEKKATCSTLDDSADPCVFHSRLFRLCGEDGQIGRHDYEIMFGKNYVELGNVSITSTDVIPPACLEVARKLLLPFSNRGVMINIVMEGKFADDQSEIAKLFNKKKGSDLVPVWFVGVKGMDGIVCYSQNLKDGAYALTIRL